MKESSKLADLQKRRFARIEITRFLWQTQHSYVRAKEKELLATLAKEKADTVLEVGCGEGANICNLRALGCQARRFIGIDFSQDKIAFCRTQDMGNSLFLCGDSLNLPFPDGLFDLVFCRDLLHHVNHDRTKAMSEMIRVCKRDAKTVIIESNGRKLSLVLLAMVCPIEKGMMDSTPKRVKRMARGLERSATLEEFIMLEPSNLFRVVLHYQFGFPFLAGFRWIGKVLDLVYLVSSKVIPENRWAYSMAVLRKRA